VKLLRFGERNAERPGLLDGQGRIRDLSGIVDDVAGDVLSRAGLKRLMALDTESLALIPEEVRLGPCVGRVGKLVCIGLNYADHAREAGLAPPEEPVVFLKATTSIAGPFDDVVLLDDSTSTDWEVELAVVIGEEARKVEVADAMAHVAGLCVFNDVSERDLQMGNGGQWAKGKSPDTYGPLGPWLVTPDEVPDIHDLSLYCEVNGTRVQNGSTANLLFGVDTVISHVSRFMTLLPGDVIATGTPAGVGMGQRPQRYLKPGDRMELGIEGLGAQRQLVVRSA